MNQLSLSLEASTTSLSELRREIRSWLQSHGVEPDDILLVVTELVSNAIAAAPTSVIETNFVFERRRVRIVVTDTGPGFSLEDIGSAATAGTRGRGLVIVRALTDDLDIARVGNRTTVSCAYPLG